MDDSNNARSMDDSSTYGSGTDDNNRDGSNRNRSPSGDNSRMARKSHAGPHPTATGVRASVSFGGAKGMALAAPLKAKTKRDDRRALRMGSS